jgi:hypothetical protein
MAKRFFFVCAGILCLALAYHLGANTATAQTEAKGSIKFVEPINDPKATRAWIVNDNDDIYVIDVDKLHDVAKGDGWRKFRLAAVR